VHPPVLMSRACCDIHEPFISRTHQPSHEVWRRKMRALRVRAVTAREGCHSNYEGCEKKRMEGACVGPSNEFSGASLLMALRHLKTRATHRWGAGSAVSGTSDSPPEKGALGSVEKGGGVGEGEGRIVEISDNKSRYEPERARTMDSSSARCAACVRACTRCWAIRGPTPSPSHT
jgi:hypothetical protein